MNALERSHHQDDVKGYWLSTRADYNHSVSQPHVMCWVSVYWGWFLAGTSESSMYYKHSWEGQAKLDEKPTWLTFKMADHPKYTPPSLPCFPHLREDWWESQVAWGRTYFPSRWQVSLFWKPPLSQGLNYLFAFSTVLKAWREGSDYWSEPAS